MSHNGSRAGASNASAPGAAWDPMARPRTESRRDDETDPGRRGAFVTFEGIEGSGKTTQMTRLAERLLALGKDVLVTREPGGSELGRAIRALLLRDGDAPIDPFAELLLYAADRVQHLRHIVLPALTAGRMVLCDRFVDATLAYQGYGRGLGVDAVRRLHAMPPLDVRPVRTILIDLDPGVGLARARLRNAELGIAHAEGRFESEALAFHQRVREGYLDLAAAEPFRFRIVDGESPPERVEARIADLLSDLVPELDADDAP